MNIGYNIKKLRELKNFKREFVADKLGISVSAYGKIERDETKLDDDEERLNQIEDILGVPHGMLQKLSGLNVSNINIGDNSSIMGNNGNNINQHFTELMDIHKQTITMMEGMTQALLNLTKKSQEDEAG